MDSPSLCFPCGSAGKESACNVGDLGSTPGLGRSPGEGKGYSLQYPGLGNSMDCTVHRIAKSQTRLSNCHFLLEKGMATCSNILAWRIPGREVRRGDWRGLGSPDRDAEREAENRNNLELSEHDCPGGSRGEESACNAGAPGTIPGSRRSPGGGNGNPLQYSCLGNLKDRRAWRATVHGVIGIEHNLATKPPPPPSRSLEGMGVATLVSNIL